VDGVRRAMPKEIARRRKEKKVSTIIAREYPLAEGIVLLFLKNACRDERDFELDVAN